MVVTIKLSNGVGNNMFQYIFGRLLAEHHGAKLVFNCPFDYYGLKFFDDLGIKIKRGRNVVFRQEPVDLNSLFFPCNSDINLNGYFEDYRIYINHLDKIGSWFRCCYPKNVNDLVLHMRLGDRLLYKVSYEDGMNVDCRTFSKVIRSMSFNNLYIVTDMKIWDYVTPDQVRFMQFHVDVPESMRVDARISADYFNSLVEEFKSFSPIVRCNNKLSDDFNFIRSFNNIIFQHSTFAWWAAALSNASKVGVYKLWRPSKGNKNKNLGDTNYPGWFGWR